MFKNKYSESLKSYIAGKTGYFQLQKEYFQPGILPNKRNQISTHKNKTHYIN